jgi:hypothetical protein
MEYSLHISVHSISGQPIDGPTNGPAPGPWDIQVQQRTKFKDSTMNVEIPHTASVKVNKFPLSLVPHVVLGTSTLHLVTKCRAVWPMPRPPGWANVYTRVCTLRYTLHSVGHMILIQE